MTIGLKRDYSAIEGVFHDSCRNVEWWRESVISYGIDRNDKRCGTCCSDRNDDWGRRDIITKPPWVLIVLY